MRIGTEDRESESMTAWPGWPQRGRQEGRENPPNIVALLDQDIRWTCQEHRTRLGHETKGHRPRTRQEKKEERGT